MAGRISVTCIPNTSKNYVLLWTLFNFANHCGKIIFFTWHSHFIKKNINLWFKSFHGWRLIKRKTTCPAKVSQNTKRKKWNQKSLQWSNNRAGALHENICQVRREKFIFLSQVFVHVQNIHWLVDKMFKFWELKINEQIKSISWSSVEMSLYRREMSIL